MIAGCPRSKTPPVASPRDLVRSATRPAGATRVRPDRGRGQAPPSGARLEPAGPRGAVWHRPDGHLQDRERQAVRNSLVAVRAAGRCAWRNRPSARPSALAGSSQGRGWLRPGSWTPIAETDLPDEICRPLASSRRPPAGRPKSSIKGQLAGAEVWRAGRPTAPYQAEAEAASVMPSDSSQRSASMAALQPSAAAVTAWR
jgi:hypothetical protein